MGELLITGCDAAIRKDIHTSSKMDCRNERCSGSVREREFFFFFFKSGRLRAKERVRERERTDNEQMTSYKGRFMPASGKECSQSVVKGKKGE